MKKGRFFSKILTIVGIGMFAFFSNTIEVNASLQANPNTQYTKLNGINNWIKELREMEKTGETMGLNETLNEDFTPSSQSNKIDVHMVRATEYGAIAILSASGYGNPSNDYTITSTTGNNTGVIFDVQKGEYIAATTNAGIFGTLNSRYFDDYSGANDSYKIGDAFGNASATNPGCLGWHNATSANWFGYGGAYSMLRSYGGIFGYTTTHMAGYARGVAVCGEGF